MSVLIEALCVVVPRKVLESSFEGGTEAYLAEAITMTGARYACADEHLASVSFFDPDEAARLIDRLTAAGLVEVAGNRFIEMACVDQRHGPTMPCDWLDWRGEEEGFTRAWLGGTEPGEMVSPPEWTPERSRDLGRHDVRDEPGRMFPLAREGPIETWLDLNTGQMVRGLAHRDAPATSPEAERVMAEDGPLLTALSEALASLEMIYERTDDGAAFVWMVQGDHSVYQCLAIPNEELEQVAVLTILADRVVEERRPAVMELITRLNYGLLVGNWEMDLDDGEVRFRFGVDVEGTELSQEMAQRMIVSGAATVDYHHAAIMRVIHGGATPSEVLAELEDGDEM